MPDVSVIIPVHNTAPYLPALFAALRAQTLDALEFILIDDGSSDASPALLDTFAQSEPRAQVLHQTNHGVSHARNTGIATARGRYIAFCDSDDIPGPQHYAALLELATKQELQLAFVNGVHFRQHSGDDDRPLFRPDTPTEPQTGAAFLTERVQAQNQVWNVFLCLIQRDWLQASGIRFQEQIVHEDVLWYVQVLLACPRVGFADLRHYLYRLHESSIMGRSDIPHRLHRLHSYASLIEALLVIEAGPYRQAVTQLALEQFRNAIWLAQTLPRAARLATCRDFRRRGLLAALWPRVQRGQDYRRLIRTWLLSWLGKPKVQGS